MELIGSEFGKHGRRSLRALSVCCLFGLGFTGVDVGAQDSVPASLLHAMLTSRDRGAEVFLGDVPAAATMPVPIRTGDRAIGGLRGATYTVLVFRVDDEPGVAVERYSAHLSLSGWDPGPMWNDRGGFTLSRMMSSGIWCSADATLQVSAGTYNAVSFLRVRVSERELESVCSDAPPGLMRQRYGARLPTLTPPEGATVTGGSSGGSSGGFDMDVNVETDLSATELAAHYRAQLSAAGWTERDAAAQGGVAMSRWTTANDSGAPMIGLFGVWATPLDGVYRAWVRMEALPRPR